MARASPSVVQNDRVNRHHRAWSLLLVGLLVLTAAVVAGASAGPVEAAPAGSSKFVPYTGPGRRQVDTRDGLGIPAGLRAPGTIDVWQVPAPFNATAVVLNVLITDSVGPGFVQVFPTGKATPGSSSNLNVAGRGSTIANLVIVPLGTDGKISFYNHAGGHLVADVIGHLVESSSSDAGRLVSLAAPNRVLDTRDPFKVPVANPGDTRNCGDFSTWNQANLWMWTYIRHGDIANLDGNGDRIPCESLPDNPGRVVVPPDLFKIASGGTYRLPIRTNATPAGGVVAAESSAVVMNVTVTESVGPGYLQVFNEDFTKQQFSNLNYGTADIAPNLVIAPIAADGSVKIYAHAGTHVIVDIVGYFTDATAPSATAGLFVPFPPDRLINTRDEGGVRPRLHLRNIDVASRAGLNPADVGAMFINSTLTDSLSAGYLQIYPTGTSTPGASSTVNVTGPNQIRPNAVISGVASGHVTVYLQAGGNFILDAAGYFLSGPG
jgi:hypothetical protein